MLLILAVWRYIYKRFPLKYESAVLGRGISARYVCGRHPRNVTGDEFRFPRVYAASLPVHRAARVAAGLCRDDPQRLAPSRCDPTSIETKAIVVDAQLVRAGPFTDRSS